MRARARIADASAVARRGRYASAERMLRDALGVLERRRRYAGAARAAATLGSLLRERGQGERAGAVMRQAQLLFESAHSVRTGNGSAPGVDLAGAEREDYFEAQALLRRPSAPPRPAPPPNGRPGAALEEFAGDLVALLRASEPTADQGTLERICGALRRRLDAKAVAVYRLGRPAALLASAGDVERQVHETIRDVVGRGAIAPLAPGGRDYRTAVPIRGVDGAAGALVVRWARAPDDLDRLVALARVASAICESDVRERLRREHEVETLRAHGSLLGRSPEMAVLRETIARVAAAPYPILIEGETGAGKELVARDLHRQGPRRVRAFCAVNCAALTDDLFEAELFGHSRGAFTGAVTERAGLFEAADRGTLFLDEVGELSPRAQAKLLRVIQEGEIRRVGENAVRRVDVQLIAATNRSLEAEAAAGRFRQDLLFRLAVVSLRVPPLRDRPGDVELLARHFWAGESARAGKRATLGAATVEAMVRYAWPGNVRELQNVVARLAVDAPRRGPVGPGALPDAVRGVGGAAPATLLDARQAFDRRFVRAALGRTGGRPVIAARELGISRQGLAKLVKRLGLDGAP